ncbi:MAG: mechanosensitive ion channel family protein [Gammaproteobacteria bacterium]|nr:mechanosensitive ion channel family protein [Gammaproteobacteria bacterium]
MEEYIQIILQKTASWLPRLGSATFILLFFWLLIKFIAGLIMGLVTRLELDQNLSMLFVRSARVGLWTLGLITMFGTLGVDITALVAGLGLTGFALGFALKDTISNMLSGVLILLYRPFRIGDQLKLSSYEGKVVSIDLRYTIIINEEQKILIPNSKLFTEPLIVQA